MCLSHTLKASLTESIMASLSGGAYLGLLGDPPVDAAGLPREIPRVQHEWIEPYPWWERLIRRLRGQGTVRLGPLIETGYARYPALASASSDLRITVTTEARFAPKTNWETITGVALYDQPVGGQMLVWSDAGPQHLGVGETMSIAQFQIGFNIPRRLENNGPWPRDESDDSDESDDTRDSGGG